MPTHLKLNSNRYAILIFALLLYLAFRLYILLKMPYNIDELVHAHQSWLHTQGWRFLIDDIEFSRPPFLRFLLIPLFHFLGEQTLIWHRVVMSIWYFIGLFFFYAAIKNATHSRKAAAVSIAFAAVCAPSLIPAQQIRYEPCMVMFMGAAFFLLVDAESKRLSGLRFFWSGVFFGVALGIKFLVAPYLLAVWLLTLIRLSKNSRSKGIIYALTLGSGMIAPNLSLIYFYWPLIKVAAADMNSLPENILGTSGAIQLAVFQFSSFQFLQIEPLFWILGFASLILAVIHHRRFFRESTLAHALFFGTLIYFIFVPLVKKQMHLQDLIFPAIAMSFFIGAAWDRIRTSGREYLKYLIFFIIVCEGAITTFYQVSTPRDNATQAQMNFYRLQEKLSAHEGQPQLAEAFMAIYKLSPPHPYNYMISRSQQDAGIRYFNKHLDTNEVGLASNSLNVFRFSGNAWVIGLLALEDIGLEKLLEVTRRLPDGIQRFLQCGNGGMLIDIRTSGMGENLVRELEHTRPKVALIDRFMINLWLKYPEYLSIFDKNYEIRCDSDSSLVFAHRTSGSWTPSGLPSLEPPACEYQ
jgi:hypothetical protein